MLVDTHAHLCFKQFAGDRDKVINQALKADVLIINSSVGLDEIDCAKKLAADYDNVFWTLGLGVSGASEQEYESTVAKIRSNQEGIVGIGEVGLDYYWVKDRAQRRLQEKIFRRFIEQSIEMSLPLVVHSRDAEEDAVRILGEYDKPALLHCYSGSVETAIKAIDFGCLISIPANVTHVKSRMLMAEKIPLESLVLETDSPYLSPVRGERNTPVNVKKSAEKIAGIKNTTPGKVGESTTRNALEFFDINL